MGNKTFDGGRRDDIVLKCRLMRRNQEDELRAKMFTRGPPFLWEALFLSNAYVFIDYSLEKNLLTKSRGEGRFNACYFIIRFRNCIWENFLTNAKQHWIKKQEVTLQINQNIFSEAHLTLIYRCVDIIISLLFMFTDNNYNNNRFLLSFYFRFLSFFIILF